MTNRIFLKLYIIEFFVEIMFLFFIFFFPLQLIVCSFSFMDDIKVHSQLGYHNNNHDTYLSYVLSFKTRM
jgi:hypothetical protein